MLKLTTGLCDSDMSWFVVELSRPGQNVVYSFTENLGSRCGGVFVMAENGG